MPRSPCSASAGCKKNDGVPVDENVAAIFRPISPDLPMPVTTTRPLHANSSSTARSNAASSRAHQILRSLRLDAQHAPRRFEAHRAAPAPAHQLGKLRQPAPAAPAVDPVATHSSRPKAPAPDRSCTSRKIPSTPAAQPARASGSINSGCPPLAFPARPAIAPNASRQKSPGSPSSPGSETSACPPPDSGSQTKRRAPSE